MQLAIVPAGDKWHIVKRLIFDELQKLVKVEAELACGSVYCHSRWPHNPYNTKKIFQKIFEGLGGFQVRHGKWAGDSDEKKPVDFSKIAAGYAFMRKMRPSSNNEGQFAEWVDIWTKKPESPILDWSEAVSYTHLTLPTILLV
eukprot:460364-Pyramimonas_sp.AAC.1